MADFYTISAQGERIALKAENVHDAVDEVVGLRTTETEARIYNSRYPYGPVVLRFDEQEPAVLAILGMPEPAPAPAAPVALAPRAGNR